MKNRISIAFLAYLIGGILLFAQSFEEGLQQFRRQNYDSAKKIFSQNTTDPNYIYWLGQTMLAQKNKESEVKTLYLNAIAQFPKSDLLKIGHSQIEMGEGKLADAKNIQSQAIKNNSKDMLIYEAIGRAHLLNKNNDLDYVINLLTKVAEYNAKKKNAEIPLILAQLYLRKQNTSDATYALREANEMDTYNAEPLYVNAQMYSLKSNENITKRYLELMNQTITKDPKFAPAYYDLFYHYYETDKEKAKEYFEKYLTLVDKTPDTEYLEANIYYNLGNYNKAIQLSNNAVTKYTTNINPKFYKVLSFSYLKQDNFALAFENLEKYLEQIDSKEINYGDYIEVANISGKLNLWDTVSVYLNKAMDITTDNGQRYNVSAKGIELYEPKVKEFKEDLNAALPYRTELAKWREVFYKNHQAPSYLELYSWGLENYYLGNWAKTLEVFKQYMEKYPEHVDGYFFSGIASKELNDIANSEIYLNKVVEIGMKDVEKNKFFVSNSLYNLADIAIMNKDYAKAKEYGKIILSYDPNDENGKALVQ